MRLTRVTSWFESEPVHSWTGCQLAWLHLDRHVHVAAICADALDRDTSGKPTQLALEFSRFKSGKPASAGGTGQAARISLLLLLVHGTLSQHRCVAMGYFPVPTIHGGSSVVEHPPCRREVGGSNPLPVSCCALYPMLTFAGSLRWRRTSSGNVANVRGYFKLD